MVAATSASAPNSLAPAGGSGGRGGASLGESFPPFYRGTQCPAILGEIKCEPWKKVCETSWPSGFQAGFVAIDPYSKGNLTQNPNMQNRPEGAARPTPPYPGQ